MEIINTINVEIVIKKNSTAKLKNILTACETYFNQNEINTTVISTFGPKHSVLTDNIDCLLIDLPIIQKPFNLDIKNASFFLYTLNTTPVQIETCDDNSAGEINLASHWLLPSLSLFNIWENLIYDEDIKNNLLQYASSMMLLSDKGVDCNIVSYNRVILLHGPPGTGKTSLCRALAHKLSIRLQDRFKNSLLIEINSQSLFSKWFSESSKLVAKMFENINDVLSDTSTLVCVLIDEIESLAHTRESCMSGNEPTDSMKVVNSMLTHIDQLKAHPNVLLLTTSNITGAIDGAFLDRADIKQYIGPPGPKAIFTIYLSCIKELIKTGIIIDDNVICNSPDKLPGDVRESLNRISSDSVGLSGRTLRKLPLLALALFLKTRLVNVRRFIDAMSEAIDYEINQRNNFGNKRI